MTIYSGLTLVDFDPPSTRSGMDIAVEGDTIAAVGERLADAYPGAAVVPSPYLATPGLVCSHHHLYSALARGMLVDIAPSRDFVQQLGNLWWRLDRAIDEDILRSSVEAGLCEAARAGVSAIVDHHASPGFVDGSLSVEREAFERAGMRGLLCYETTDRNGVDGALAGVRENERFAAEAARARDSGKSSPLVGAMIGAHAPFTLSDGTLDRLGALSRASGCGVHVHVAEDAFDAVDSRYRHGLEPMARLDRHGLLGERGIVAHGVHLAEEDIGLVNERGAFLAHNARSNMNNRVGYNARLPLFERAVLGTDGMGCDMLEELRFAFFRHREAGGALDLGFFCAALDRGNRVLESWFGKRGAAMHGAGVNGAAIHGAAMHGARFGRLEKGCVADITFWDYAPPTPLEARNVAGHLAFGWPTGTARSTMVAGRFAMKDGALAVDEKRIMAEARTQAARLWKRMEEGAKL